MARSTLNTIVNCHIAEAVERLHTAECGAHYMVIYPNSIALSDLYSSYTHKQIEENNGVVQINPFYETTESVRRTLAEKYDDGMNDVVKLENEDLLVIVDSVEEYFDNPSHLEIKSGLADYCRQRGKSCLSVMADMGAYYYKSKYDNLVDYEASLPAKFDIPMKGFCLYHQKDFGRFSEEQKQKLIEHHGKVIEII
ncbi:MAG TPA: hypothetical protein VJ729_01135 [Nitrososphaeraceae archaeon]|nr:hypothetical protein [Nitrososphaeraceae archaeon]